MANWKILTIISVLIGLGGLTLVIVLFTATGGYVPFDYGIVLDAGSSHTQITLYHWLANKNRCTGVVEQLASCNIDSGISSYNTSDIDSIGKDLLNCVQNVSQKIDKTRLTLTPLYLGATAGMRLLNKTDPQSVKLIFEIIRNKFKLQTQLQIKTIDIISGQDEGLFSWVTNNYLAEKLIVEEFDESKPNSTIGMLDMGGASAQIAYRVGSKLNTSGDEINVRLYGINHTVRSTSNLCFGADQAMLRYQKFLIMSRNRQRGNEIDSPCLPIGSKIVVSGQKLKNQACLKLKDSSREIDFNQNYTFNGISSYVGCSKLIDEEILNLTKCTQTFQTCFNVSDTRPPESTQFYAISSYYYTVRVLNLSQPFTVDQYIERTTNFCDSDRTTIESNPLVSRKYIDVYCFQLNYIHTTIQRIYRFADNMWSKIFFSNTVRNADLGWSLGFMINATNAIAAEKPTPPMVELFPFILVSILCALILSFSIYFALKWIKSVENQKRESYEPISINVNH